LSIYLFSKCDKIVLDFSHKILYPWPVVGDGGGILQSQVVDPPHPPPPVGGGGLENGRAHPGD